MKKLVVSLMVLAAAVAAQASVTATYSWEGSTVDLGSYGNVVSTEISTDVAYSGSSSLKITEEDSSSGTPQVYVGYVTGLSDGDTITAGFWVYDTSEGVSPSGRIWAHYCENDDITDYKTSASGNYDYSDGTGWTYLEYTWTYDESKGGTGFVIEARIYGVNDSVEDFIYVDDITVTCSNDAATIVVPEPATMALLGLGALVLRRKK